MAELQRAQAQRTASTRATSERWPEGMYEKKPIIQKQRCKRSPSGAPLCLTNTAHPGPVGSPQPPLFSLCRKRRLRPRRQPRRAAASPPAPLPGSFLPPCDTPPLSSTRRPREWQQETTAGGEESDAGAFHRPPLARQRQYMAQLLAHLPSRPRGGRGRPDHRAPTGDMR